MGGGGVTTTPMKVESLYGVTAAALITADEANL